MRKKLGRVIFVQQWLKFFSRHLKINFPIWCLPFRKSGFFYFFSHLSKPASVETAKGCLMPLSVVSFFLFLSLFPLSLSLLPLLFQSLFKSSLGKVFFAVVARVQRWFAAIGPTLHKLLAFDLTSWVITIIFLSQFNLQFLSLTTRASCQILQRCLCSINGAPSYDVKSRVTVQSFIASAPVCLFIILSDLFLLSNFRQLKCPGPNESHIKLQS